MSCLREASGFKLSLVINFENAIRVPQTRPNVERFRLGLSTVHTSPKRQRGFWLCRLADTSGWCGVSAMRA